MKQQQEQSDRKYYSVKNFGDMRSKSQDSSGGHDKYFSMDTRCQSVKALPADLRAKLRDNLNNPYKPVPGYPNPPPPPVQRKSDSNILGDKLKQRQATQPPSSQSSSNLEKSILEEI